MKKLYAIVPCAALIVAAATASAHVSIISTSGIANGTQELFFGVGHGCAGADTYAVKVQIPPGVTSVRAERSDFGNPAVTRDVAGNVTTVTWQKPESELLPEDTGYYKLALRLKLPNQPFTTLAFPAVQTCKATDGGVSVVPWDSAALADGGVGEPSPTITIVPARKAGWNKYTVPVAIPDLGVYFSDARIVWQGTAAWSSNPETAAQIGATPGVTPLASLRINDEIWVSY